MRFDDAWPENTSVRKRKGFTWLPMSINGDGRWLEKVEWYEECVHYVRKNTGEDLYYRWKPICWADDIRGRRAFLVKRKKYQ